MASGDGGEVGGRRGVLSDMVLVAMMGWPRYGSGYWLAFAPILFCLRSGDKLGMKLDGQWRLLPIEVICDRNSPAAKLWFGM